MLLINQSPPPAQRVIPAEIHQPGSLFVAVVIREGAVGAAGSRIAEALELTPVAALRWLVFVTSEKERLVHNQQDN